MEKKKSSYNFSLKFLLFVGVLLAFLIHIYAQFKLFENIEEATSISAVQLKFFDSYYAKNKKSLYLNKLTQIDESFALTLSKFEGDHIYLNGVTQIDESIALILIQFRGQLHLKGLKGTSFVEQILRQWDLDILRVKVPKNLSQKLIFILSNFRGDALFLSEVYSLDETNATTLIKWKGNRLVLSQMAKVDRKTARVLAHWDGKFLAMNDLTQIDESIVLELAQFNGKMSLASLMQDETLNQILKNWNNNFLEIKNLYTIHTADALFLSKWKGDCLVLNNEYFMKGTAEILSKYNGQELHLNKLTALDKRKAEELSQFKGKKLVLKALSQIDESVAKALSQFKGEILASKKIKEQIKKYNE